MDDSDDIKSFDVKKTDALLLNNGNASVSIIVYLTLSLHQSLRSFSIKLATTKGIFKK